MEWRRVGAIGVVLIDEFVFTVFYFVILPLFNVYLPLRIYGAVMLILVLKDIVVVKLIWQVVVRTPQVGKESLVGKIGVAITDVDPYGTIRIENELWKAETSEMNPLKKGEQVEVLTVNGLFLKVKSAR